MSVRRYRTPSRWSRLPWPRIVLAASAAALIASLAVPGAQVAAGPAHAVIAPRH